jgi:hypothetical protein
MPSPMTGTHALILEYNAMAEQMNALDLALMDQRRKIDSTYSAEPNTPQKYNLGSIIRGSLMVGPDSIRFELVPYNTAELAERKEVWGDRARALDPGVKTTVGYRYCSFIDADTQVQVEGIVCGGGGKFFLTLDNSVAYPPFIPCSREEWDLIAAGNIPQKFLPDWFVVPVPEIVPAPDSEVVPAP